MAMGIFAVDDMGGTRRGVAGPAGAEALQQAGRAPSRSSPTC